MKLFDQTYRQLLRLALPMTLTQFISIASGFICMAMVGHLGHAVLAACALIFAVQMTMAVIATAVLYSLGFLIGYAHGAKHPMMVGSFVQQAWIFGICVSIPMMYICLHIAWILQHFGQASALLPLVQQFFSAYAWAALPLTIAVTNQQFCYAIGQAELAVSASLSSVVVLIMSAIILVFGKLGAPALGVAGLGYAMALQVWTSVLFTMFCFVGLPVFKPFALFKLRIHKSTAELLRMLKLGWPICLQMGGELLSLFANAIMVGWLGVVTLGAYQVVSQYLILSIIPIFALSQASGMLLGQANGAKRFTELHKLGKSAVFLTLIFTGLVVILFLCLPRQLAGLYLVGMAIPTATLQMIVMLFMIVAVTQILDGCRNVLTGMLRGLFDSRYPMLLSLTAIWIIGIPLSYCLSFPLQMGIYGIPIGSGIGMVLGVGALWWRWQTRLRQFEAGKG